MIEKLFGARGACGGCWCMYWRLPRGGKLWQESKGEPNRKAMKKLIKAGKVHGLLAFDGRVPVGWCSFGPRAEFPRLDRVKAYRTEDDVNPWSINCFYLAKEYRGQKLAFRLAEAAVKAIRHKKGRVIEAYPATLTRDGVRLPAAFAYTGPEKIFQDLGFKEVQRKAASRPLYRLRLK